jgi:O-antigen/teichoic acid export membrane protein
MRTVGLLLATWFLLFSPGARGQPPVASYPGAGTGHDPALADADLARRVQRASLPGVKFRFAPLPQPPPPPESVQPPDCQQPAAGLCDINWRSMPRALRPLPVAAASLEGAEVLLRTQTGQPVLYVRPGEVGVAFAAADPHPERADTPEGALRRWPYFNYLLHLAACRAGGQAVPRYGDFAHGPLPGKALRQAVLVAGVALWLLFFALLQLARRPAARGAESLSWMQGGAALNASTAAAAISAAWTRAGFARPLSGLLTLLSAMVLLIGPYFALQSLLGQHVQPFPEADGLWRDLVGMLMILWLTFDLGTQTAMVKYFAEHRVVSPQDALRDVQFYVWFQLLSRLVEASFLVALVLGYLPYSTYAMYTPLALLYAAYCLPSVSGLGKLLCQALQRFDYQNLLDLAEQRLLVFLVPIPFVLGFRAWGRGQPDFGEAYGAAIGLGVGTVATQLVVMALGFYALRRLGVPLRPLFRAHFDRATVRRQLLFGVKTTIGQEPYRFTQALESQIIIRSLADFPALLGIRDLINNRLAFLFFFAWSYYQSAVPAVSEAMAAKKERLVQYYVARYLQFGFLFSALIFSMLCAVGPLFIRGALGAQWSRAGDYLVLGCLSGLLLPLAWLSDSLQQGAGRPGTNTVVMLVEQGVRLLLLLLLVPRLQFAGIYVATLLALGLKCGFGWVLNHRLIVRLRLPVWQTFGAPAVAGLGNYALWWAVSRVLAPQSTTAVLLLFFVAGATSFVIGLFLSAAVGGIDPAAQRELDDGAQMSALMRPLCQVLAGAARLGSRLSPWPARTSSLAAEAAVEAAELGAGPGHHNGVRSL